MKAGRPKSLLTKKEEEIMQILWDNGQGGVFLYRAVTQRDSVRKTRLGEFAANFFKGSYLGIVSELVKDEKISVDELKELIDMIESGNK